MRRIVIYINKDNQHSFRRKLGVDIEDLKKVLTEAKISFKIDEIEGAKLYKIVLVNVDKGGAGMLMDRRFKLCDITDLLVEIKEGNFNYKDLIFAIRKILHDEEFYIHVELDSRIIESYGCLPCQITAEN